MLFRNSVSKLQFLQTTLYFVAAQEHFKFLKNTFLVQENEPHRTIKAYLFILLLLLAILKFEPMKFLLVFGKKNCQCIARVCAVQCKVLTLRCGLARRTVKIIAEFSFTTSRFNFSTQTPLDVFVRGSMRTRQAHFYTRKRVVVVLWRNVRCRLGLFRFY